MNQCSKKSMFRCRNLIILIGYVQDYTDSNKAGLNVISKELLGIELGE